MHLAPNDRCRFLGIYKPRAGSQHSKFNDLIINFKKPMHRKGLPEWKYKERAIDIIAAKLASSLELYGTWAQTVTWVPIPPSRAKGDPEYDDRLLQVLYKVSQTLQRHQKRQRPLDIRGLIRQKKSTQPSHLSSSRPSPDAIAANYFIDESLMAASIQCKVALFDDVITTGAHFKAAQSVLKQRVPDVVIGGIFIARAEREQDR